MDSFMLATTGPRDEHTASLVAEAMKNLPESSDDERSIDSKDPTDRNWIKCIKDKSIDASSLCFMIKSKAYNDCMSDEFKAAAAIELKVTLNTHIFIKKLV